MNQELARKLYFHTLRIRKVEMEIAQRYPLQEMRCPVHLSVGQEATPVGVSMALSPEDNMVSTHRAHAHYLAKGGNLKELISELYGRVTGCTKGQGGSMHLIDLKVNFLGATSIVGGTIPIGVGAAFAAKLKKQKTVTVVCLGDTAVEEGVFHECANFASLHNLSVLFMCENNGYSCYSPLKNRQPNRPLTDVAKAHNIQAYTVDGNNVFEVYEKTKPLIDQIREKSRPLFIEYPTYRYLEHCGPYEDDHLNYRPSEELDRWKDNDCIKIGRECLKIKNFWTPEWEEEMTTQIDKEIDESFEYSINSPYPELSQLGAYTYAK